MTGPGLQGLDDTAKPGDLRTPQGRGNGNDGQGDDHQSLNHVRTDGRDDAPLVAVHDKDQGGGQQNPKEPHATQYIHTQARACLRHCVALSLCGCVDMPGGSGKALIGAEVGAGPNGTAVLSRAVNAS